MSFRLIGQRLKVSEKDVTKACLDVLWAHHWWPIRQHVGLFTAPNGDKIPMHKTGDPDYVVVKPPSFFLELKAPGGKLSDVQRKRIAELKHFYNLDTVVVYSVEELVEFLDRHERSP